MPEHAEALALPHGCVAELVLSEDDRADVLPAGKRSLPAPPMPTERRRRWAFNDHLWETCSCHDCGARRAGHLGREHTGRQPE